MAGFQIVCQKCGLACEAAWHTKDALWIDFTHEIEIEDNNPIGDFIMLFCRNCGNEIKIKI